MWKEWLNPYNPFNGMKVLRHYDQLSTIVKWQNDGDVKLPPPVMVTVDPTNLCNVNCFWCKNRRFRETSPRSIEDTQLVELPAFLKKWGVKAVVLSGGEPLMHPKIVEFLNNLGTEGLSVGIKTNGLALTKPALRKAVMAHVGWIGFTLDAASNQTYLKVKKATANAFEKVIANIKWLVDNRADERHPKIALRYLIHHITFSEMYAFANMARIMNVEEVYFRPFYQSKYRFAKGVRKTAGYYLREARKDFEDENFRIYGLVYRFDREWERIIRFKKCFGTPLSGVFAADGNFYLCADRRGEKEVSLGKFYPFDLFQKKWGSVDHRKLVEQITPQLCPRCGLSITNEVVERCILDDEMYLDFV